MQEVGREHPDLPDDLNLQYDLLSCAVAAGWDGALVEDLELVAHQDDGLLRFVEENGGKRTSVVTEADGRCLEEGWLRAVTSA